MKGGTTVTVTNRHFDQPATLTLVVPGAKAVAQATILAADSPRAVNSAEAPDRVAPRALEVQRDGADGWRLELPPHALATVVMRAS